MEKYYDTGVITAFKGSFTKKENLQRNKSLLAKLASLGYKITECLGYSGILFVEDYKNVGKLKHVLGHLGRMFDQKYVTFISKDYNKSIIPSTQVLKETYCGNNAGRYAAGLEAKKHWKDLEV